MKETEMHKVCKDKIEDLSLMADGLLSIEKTRELEKHLTLCPACSRYYSDIKAMKSSMATLSIDTPDNINELISKAVRKAPVTHPVKKNYRRYIYRYATVAAACLVLVVFIVVRGGIFNTGSDNANESAELRGMDSVAEAEFSNDLALTFDGDEQSNSLEEASKAAPNPEEMDQTEPSVDEVNPLYGSLSEYRYATSAIETENFLIVNPDGLPLDSGYGGMQDIFYASEAFTIDEISVILTREFNVLEILSENENLFFHIDSKNLPKLESRLVLVSSNKLEEKKNSVAVRIVAIKNTDNE